MRAWRTGASSSSRPRATRPRACTPCRSGARRSPPTTMRRASRSGQLLGRIGNAELVSGISDLYSVRKEIGHRGLAAALRAPDRRRAPPVRALPLAGHAAQDMHEALLASSPRAMR
jgi:hypothetical protein